MYKVIFLEFTNSETDSKICINLYDISTIEELPNTGETSITLKNGTSIFAKENYELVKKNIQTLQTLQSL